ncbi:MAG: tetratricopeptide repeat protein, partial [Planctomycetaceae bacterium]
LNYAAMQMTRGDTESARASLDALEKYDPQANGLLKMQAAVALREAELPRAASILQEHLQSNPGDAEAWLTLSEIQLKLGDFSASEESRRKGREAGGG